MVCDVLPTLPESVLMKCPRCHEPVERYRDDKCPYCGVHKDRRVVKRFRKRAHRPTKHGRNSGKVGTAKNK